MGLPPVAQTLCCFVFIPIQPCWMIQRTVAVKCTEIRIAKIKTIQLDLQGNKQTMVYYMATSQHVSKENVFCFKLQVCPKVQIRRIFSKKFEKTITHNPLETYYHAVLISGLAYLNNCNQLNLTKQWDVYESTLDFSPSLICKIGF